MSADSPIPIGYPPTNYPITTLHPSTPGIFPSPRHTYPIEDTYILTTESDGTYPGDDGTTYPGENLALYL